MPVADWRVYYRYKLLTTYAPDLPAKFVQRQFEFNDRTVSGIEELKPRWKAGDSARYEMTRTLVRQADGNVVRKATSRTAVEVEVRGSPKLEIWTLKGAWNASTAARLSASSCGSAQGSSTALGMMDSDEPPEWRSMKASASGNSTLLT